MTDTLDTDGANKNSLKPWKQLSLIFVSTKYRDGKHIRFTFCFNVPDVSLVTNTNARFASKNKRRRRGNSFVAPRITLKLNQLTL